MPKYRVSLPNGAQYDVEAREGASNDEIFALLDEARLSNPELDIPSPTYTDSYGNEFEGDRRAPEPTSEEGGDWGKGFGAGIDSLQATGYGLVGLVGDTLGLDSVRDWGFEGYQRNMDDVNKVFDQRYSFEDWGKTDLLDAAQYWSGYAIPNLATGGLSSFVGKKIVERGIKNAVDRGAKNFAEKEIARRIRNGQLKGVAAQGVGLELGATYGEAGQEALGEGKTLDDVDLGDVYTYGTAAGLLETGADVATLGLARFGPAKDLMDVSKKGGRLRQAATRGGVGGTIEGFTEQAQTGLEQMGAGKSFEEADFSDPTSFAAGFIGGGQVGATSGLLRKPPTDTGADDDVRTLADEEVALQVQRAQEQQQVAAQQAEEEQARKKLRIKHAESFPNEDDFYKERSAQREADLLNPETEIGAAFEQWQMDNDVYDKTPKVQKQFLKEFVAADDGALAKSEYLAQLDEHAQFKEEQAQRTPEVQAQVDQLKSDTLAEYTAALASGDQEAIRLADQKGNNLLNPAEWREAKRVNASASATKNGGLTKSVKNTLGNSDAVDTDGNEVNNTDGVNTTATADKPLSKKEQARAYAAEKLGETWQEQYPELSQLVEDGKSVYGSSPKFINRVNQFAAEVEAAANREELLNSEDKKAALASVSARVVNGTVAQTLKGNQQKVFTTLLNALRDSQTDAYIQMDGAFNTTKLAEDAGVTGKDAAGAASAANKALNDIRPKLAQAFGVTEVELAKLFSETGQTATRGDDTQNINEYGIAGESASQTAQIENSVADLNSDEASQLDMADLYGGDRVQQTMGIVSAGGSQSDVGRATKDELDAAAARPDPVGDARQQQAKEAFERQMDQVLSAAEARGYLPVAAQQWVDTRSEGVKDFDALPKQAKYEWLLSMADAYGNEESLSEAQRDIERRFDLATGGVTQEELDAQDNQESGAVGQTDAQAAGGRTQETAGAGVGTITDNAEGGGQAQQEGVVTDAVQAIWEAQDATAGVPFSSLTKLQQEFVKKAAIALDAGDINQVEFDNRIQRVVEKVSGARERLQQIQETAENETNETDTTEATEEDSDVEQDDTAPLRFSRGGTQATNGGPTAEANPQLAQDFADQFDMEPGDITFGDPSFYDAAVRAFEGSSLAEVLPFLSGLHIITPEQVASTEGIDLSPYTKDGSHAWYNERTNAVVIVHKGKGNGYLRFLLAHEVAHAMEATAFGYIGALVPTFRTVVNSTTGLPRTFIGWGAKAYQRLRNNANIPQEIREELFGYPIDVSFATDLESVGRMTPYYREEAVSAEMFAQLVAAKETWLTDPETGERRNSIWDMISEAEPELAKWIEDRVNEIDNALKNDDLQGLDALQKYARDPVGNSEETEAGQTGSTRRAVDLRKGAGRKAVRRSGLRKDPKTIRDSVKNNFGEKATELFDTGADILKAGLGSLKFLHQRIREVADTLPSAQRWYNAIKASEKTRNEIRLKVESIAVRAREMQEAKLNQVNDFISKSTYYQKWGYDPNIAGRTVKVDPIMEAAFSRLDPEQQQLVKDVFAHGEEMLQRRRDIARRMGVSGTFFVPSAMQGPYAPLKRFGNNVVVLKSAEMLDAEAALREKNNEINRKKVQELKSNEDHYVISFFDTMGEAKKFRDANKDKYKLAKAEKKIEDADRTVAPNAQVLQKVLAAVNADDQSGLDTKAKDAFASLVKDMWFRSLDESNARQSQRPRESVAGYEKNMIRSFLDHASAEAYLIAQMEHGAEINAAMTEARKEALSNENEGLSGIYNELRSHYVDSLTPRRSLLENIQNRIAAFNTVWILTSSLGYHVTNATQPGMVTIPKLAGDFNDYSGALKALAAGYAVARAVVKADIKNFQTNVDISRAPAKYRAMLEELQLRQLLDVGIEQDLQEFRRTNTGSETINKISAAASQTAHRLYQAARLVEAYNRVSSAVAAYDMAIKKPKATGGMSALDYAVSVVEDTQGNFSAMDAPLLLKKLPKITGQYRKYQIMMGWVYANAAKAAFKGATPQERAAGKRVLTYMLAHAGVFSGLTGVPLLSTAFWFASLWDGDDEPEDFERWIRDNIDDENLAEVIARGVPSLLGIDMSTKLSQAKIFHPAPYTEFDGTEDGFKKGVFEIFAGPSATTVGSFFRAKDFAKEGDAYRAIESALPKGLRTAAESYRIATEGYTLRNGDLVANPTDFDVFSLAVNALGLPASDIRKLKWTRGQQFELNEWFDSQSSELQKEYIKAYNANDNGELKRVEDEWYELQDAKDRVRPFFNDAPSALPRQSIRNLIRAPRNQYKRESKYRDQLGTN